MPELPRAECKFGYPVEQLRRYLGAKRFAEFQRWAEGATGTSCDGQAWNPMRQEFNGTDCGPHGVVVHEWDVRRFLTGQRRVG